MAALAGQNEQLLRANWVVRSAFAFVELVAEIVAGQWLALLTCPLVERRSAELVSLASIAVGVISPKVIATQCVLAVAAKFVKSAGAHRVDPAALPFFKHIPQIDAGAGVSAGTGLLIKLSCPLLILRSSLAVSQ